MSKDLRKYNWGVELELANTDNSKITELTPLPDNWYRTGDGDVMNTKPYPVGANDEDLSIYRYGGEYNSPPYYSKEDFINGIKKVLDYFPEAETNHMLQLHIHISWDNIKEDWEGLKRYALYADKCHDWVGENIWNPILTDDMTRVGYRWLTKWMQPRLSEDKINKLKLATTIQEVIDAFRWQNGKSNPMSVRRYYCYVYNALKNGGYSIEHKQFFASTNMDRICSTIDFVNEFANNALSDNPQPIEEWGSKYISKVPTFDGYDKTLDILWQNTCLYNKDIDKTMAVRENIIKNYGIVPTDELIQGLKWQSK